jgi:hypothetical protein
LPETGERVANPVGVRASSQSIFPFDIAALTDEEVTTGEENERVRKAGRF